jgi:CDP-glycerol glycerophosphotransferase (TagB/SpsB family)
MTFAYYVAWDYSPALFASKELDYTLHDKPIELWGTPGNVVAAITAHNAVIRELAASRDGVTFVDQEQLIPKRGAYFNDICHFTHLGTEAFVANLLDPITARAH